MTAIRNDSGGAADSGPSRSVLRVEGLVKRFHGVPALDDVDFEVGQAEVHGLLGANGSGKSTLIKVLAGVYDADAGRIAVHGEEVPRPFGADGLRSRGLSFVHQDLGLSPAATVLEHFGLDRAATRHPLRRIPWGAERRHAAELLGRFDVAVDPDARIDQLTPVQRAMVAIVRAVDSQEERAGTGAERRSQLLVLDEPTVFLPTVDVQILFALVRRLREGGDSVVLVSHDLDEVTEICDRVTVLRDGRVAGVRRVENLEREELVELILDTRVGAASRPQPATVDPSTALRTKGLSGERIRDLELEVRPGEVVGVTGLAGSGVEELPELLYGVREATAGRIEVGGEEIRRPTPARMMDRRVVLLPADRKNLGSAPELTLLENISIPFVGEFFQHGRLRWSRLRDQTRDTCVRLGVKPADPAAVFSNLSGGNQQKALLGKWLDTKPAVMLLAEPTQGVDVGARQEIFRLVRAAVGDGAAVLCATTDYEQLVQIADRVLIFADGRVRSTLSVDQVDKESLTNAIYSGASA